MCIKNHIRPWIVATSGIVTTLSEHCFLRGIAGRTLTILIPKLSHKPYSFAPCLLSFDTECSPLPPA